MINRTLKAAIGLAVIAGVSMVPAVFAETLADFPASTQTGVTYDKDIQPIFKASCLGCHGAQRQSGRLRLDTLAATLKGGKDGPILVVGKSDQSDIVTYTARIGDTVMPPKPRTPRPAAAGSTNTPPPQPPAAKSLTKEQVGLLRAWIDQGAK